jgi:hypothetical protein
VHTILKDGWYWNVLYRGFPLYKGLTQAGATTLANKLNGWGRARI